MPFMDLYTDPGPWYVIDGRYGGAVIPEELAPGLDLTNLAACRDALGDYCEGGPDAIYSVELAHGWCARYSANGYMDCTDWVGPYPTEEQAIEECNALYGDDEDDEWEDGDDEG